MFDRGHFMAFVCPECGASLAGPVACPQDGATGVSADDPRARRLSAAARRRRLVVLGGIAVVVLVATAARLLMARDGASRPLPIITCTGPSTGTFELQTTNGYSFVVEHATERKIELAITDGDYTVDLIAFPRGTRWEVGGARGTVTSSEYTYIKAVHLADQLADLGVGEGRHSLTPHATLALTLPDCTTHQLPLPSLEADGALQQLLGRVPQGPVLFQGETGELHDPPRSLFVVAEYELPRLIGHAQRARDLDAVAIVRQLPEVKQTRTCTGYTDSDNKPAPDVALRLKDTEVVVYDRRTAKSLKRLVLPPDPSCPSIVIHIQPADPARDSSVPRAAVEAALRSMVSGA